MGARHAWVLMLVMGCGPKEYEGDTPGECSDGADNDRDRLFDCLDPDCTGASVCGGSDDDTEPDPIDDSDEEVIDTTPTDGRQPGPHASEIGLVTAWEQLEETANSVYGPGCFGLNDPDWEAVFAPPTYTGEYVYVFFRVQSGQTTAVGQNCSRGYPDGCIDSSIVYLIDGHTLTGEQEPTLVPVENVAGCTITLETVAEVEDMGETGIINYRVALSSTPACPADLQINNACEFRHEYDLVWAKVE
jgi:hypothetical protein